MLILNNRRLFLFTALEICIYVGAKLVVLLGDRGELICLTGILSCFSLFCSYPFASKGVIMIVLYLFT